MRFIDSKRNLQIVFIFHKLKLVAANLVFSTIIILALNQSSVWAEPFIIAGPRALGMGGAFVAVADGCSACLWNPAAYTHENGMDILPESVEMIKTSRLLEKIGEIKRLKGEIVSELEDNNNQISSEMFKNYFQVLTEIENLNNNGIGLVLNKNTWIGGFIKGGFSVFEHKAAVGIPQIDMINLSLQAEIIVLQGEDEKNVRDAVYKLVGDGCDLKVGDMTNEGMVFTEEAQCVSRYLSDSIRFSDGSPLPESQTDMIVSAGLDAGLDISSISEYASLLIKLASDAMSEESSLKTSNFLKNNNSRLIIKVANIEEYIFTCSRGVSKNLSIGINLKHMVGNLVNTSQSIFELDDVEGEMESALEMKTRQTEQIGVDIGILYKRNKIKCGLIGKNINAPEFLYPDGERYAIKPQFRAGIAFCPIDEIILSLDTDITKNKTMLHEDSQVMGIGVEWQVRKSLCLRYGGFQDIVSPSTVGMVFTTGLGYRDMVTSGDIAVAISEKRISGEFTNIIGSAQVMMRF